MRIGARSGPRSHSICGKHPQQTPLPPTDSRCLLARDAERKWRCPVAKQTSILSSAKSAPALCSGLLNQRRKRRGICCSFATPRLRVRQDAALFAEAREGPCKLSAQLLHTKSGSTIAQLVNRTSALSSASAERARSNVFPATAQAFHASREYHGRGGRYMLRPASPVEARAEHKGRCDAEPFGPRSTQNRKDWHDRIVDPIFVQPGARRDDGTHVPTGSLSDIKGLKGSRRRRGGQFSVSIHMLLLKIAICRDSIYLGMQLHSICPSNSHAASHLTM